MIRYFDDDTYQLPIIHTCCGSHSGKHRANCTQHPLPILHECCGSRSYKHKRSCSKAKEEDKTSDGKKKDYTCPICYEPQKINFNHEKILRLKEEAYFLKKDTDMLIWRRKVIETTIRKKEEELAKLDILHKNMERMVSELRHISEEVKNGLKNNS